MLLSVIAIRQVKILQALFLLGLEQTFRSEFASIQESFLFRHYLCE